MLISNGSGIKNVTYSRTTPFSESGNATLSENKAIISNIYKNGTYTMYAYDNAGNVSDVYTLTTTKIETLKKYLDLNGSLDGVGQGNLESFGTADIYVNGSQKDNDTTDHYIQYDMEINMKLIVFGCV